MYFKLPITNVNREEQLIFAIRVSRSLHDNGNARRKEIADGLAMIDLFGLPLLNKLRVTAHCYYITSTELSNRDSSVRQCPATSVHSTFNVQSLPGFSSAQKTHMHVSRHARVVAIVVRGNRNATHEVN